MAKMVLEQTDRIQEGMEWRYDLVWDRPPASSSLFLATTWLSCGSEITGFYRGTLKLIDAAEVFGFISKGAIFIHLVFIPECLLFL